IYFHSVLLLRTYRTATIIGNQTVTCIIHDQASYATGGIAPSARRIDIQMFTSIDIRAECYVRYDITCAIAASYTAEKTANAYDAISNEIDHISSLSNWDKKRTSFSENKRRSLISYFRLVIRS